MKKILLLLPAFLWLQLHAQDIRLKNDDLKELAVRMTGIFSNASQAAKDTGYGSMVLHMKPVWLNKNDGFWFYMEQAGTKDLSRPLKQGVYHIYRQDNRTLVIKAYELKNPEDYAGAWKDETKLYQLTEDYLTENQGCAVFLYKNSSGDYTGSTSGKGCLNSRKDVAYITSEITVDNDRIVNWERGWDAGDKQVWGAEKGGYIFIKSKD